MLVSGGDAMPLEIPAFAGMTSYGKSIALRTTAYLGSRLGQTG
jgi:hypothetical protein